MRLMEARPSDARPTRVAYRLLGHAAKERKNARTCDEIQSGKLSGEGRLGVSEVRGAENGDKYLRREHFTGSRPIDHLHGVARIVDEELLAGDMNLARRESGFRRPAHSL